MTEHLTLEDLLGLTRDLDVGPVRDLGLLDSAVHGPTTSLHGQDAYPSIDDKAAVLHESLVRNHALIDGNKRRLASSGRLLWTQRNPSRRCGR